MDEAFENTKKLMNEALDRAKKADRLHKSWSNKLKSFSIISRVIFRHKFKDVKARIEKQKWERFSCTAVGLNLARRIKHYERKKKALKAAGGS